MEYYGNALCVSYEDLVGGGIMSASNYKQLAHRGKFTVMRQGKGLGNCALVAVNSLPEKYKAEVRRLYPEGNRILLIAWVKKNYERVFGSRYNWDEMTAAIDTLRDLYHHTLPASTMRFRKKVAEYRREGYICLVSGKFGNQSARKVDHKTERLILGIAVLPNKPFNTNVAELYNMFVCGELDVYDPESGEMFNPDDFTDKNGEPMVLSETTINNYLNSPKNRVLIDHMQMSFTTYMHEVMPHVHRHAPEFSFSKISFDDRDLPRKLKDTKQRPKAYYAYDVTSQCVVGFAYNRNKNTDLVVDCFRSLFTLIERNGWGCPAQVEVENHLMSQWKDSFLKAGVMFPFVRFCAPQNSQEKYAEQMNGAKKKSVEHRNHLGIGRFYAKDRHYRTEAKKVFDELNDTYEDQEYYTWEQLIAEDMKDVEQFNQTLHPNQKKYKGMTRWQVLVENMNPTLQPMDRAIWARYIGEHVSTSIRRNSYCRVQGKDWWLSQTEVIEKLAPNDMKVEAYYLTNEQGEAVDVWIYQNDMMVDKLQDVGTFNTADAEQTDEDRAIFTEQQKKIAHFGKYVRDNAISRVGVMSKAPAAAKGDTEPETEVKNEVAMTSQHTESESWRFKNESDAISDL